MSIDDLISSSEEHARAWPGDVEKKPSRGLAVVTCMDARIDAYRLLGLEPGEAHVIRNGGGVVTDDVIRSLAVSQHGLGTEEVVVIQHTDCGLHGMDEGAFAGKLRKFAGREPEWRAGAFEDLEESVRQGMAAIAGSPFLPNTDRVRGFVFDVETGGLREVDPA